MFLGLYSPVAWVKTLAIPSVATQCRYNAMSINQSNHHEYSFCLSNQMLLPTPLYGYTLVPERIFFDSSTKLSKVTLEASALSS